MKDKTSIVIFGLAIVVVLGIVFLSGSRRGPAEPPEIGFGEKMEPVEEGTIEPGENSEDEEMEKSGVKMVVETFLDSFIASAPPESDQEAINNAVALLSEGAKMGAKKQPTSGDLARFVGVQDSPDRGYEIGKIVYKDNPASGVENGLAEVEVTLQYSGGDTERTFMLSKVGDNWQIDEVK